MDKHQLPSSTAARLFGAWLTAFLLFAFTASTASAQINGYVSSNAADLPPDLERRDVESRSTDPDRPPAYGPEDAKVLIVNFADFKCSACRRGSQANHQIAAEFPGQVRMEFWNHAPASHLGSDILAAAAIAAQRQGKFWEMHDLIFAMPRHDMATLEKYAQELDLDVEQFKSDMNDPAVKDRVRRESELATALGAPNTPGYLINGKVYQGWGSWYAFRYLVERELDQANALEAQGLDPLEIRTQREIDNHEDSESYERYRIGIIEMGDIEAGD